MKQCNRPDFTTPAFLLVLELLRQNCCAEHGRGGSCRQVDPRVLLLPPTLGHQEVDKHRCRKNYYEEIAEENIIENVSAYLE